MTIEDAKRLTVEVAERGHGLYLQESTAENFACDHFTDFAIHCEPQDIESQWGEFVRDNVLDWLHSKEKDWRYDPC